MQKHIISFFILSLFAFSNVDAQAKAETFTTKLISQEVTYNASPNPNECWEAVEWGIKIPNGKSSNFYRMNYKEFEKVKAKVGDNEVQIEVLLFQEVSEGGAVGMVSKITFKGDVLFENK